MLSHMGEAGSAAASASRKRMPELYNNVRLLVDVVRVELLDIDAKQAQVRAEPLCTQSRPKKPMSILFSILAETSEYLATRIGSWPYETASRKR